MRILTTFVISLALFSTAEADLNDKVQAALAAEARPAQDRERDRNRRPLQTLEFFGLKEDMRVLELFPGGGWYTRVLAPVLRDRGQLYVALNTGGVEESVLTEGGFEKVEVLETGANARYVRELRGYVLDDFDFGVRDLDMVLTFRNLHSYSAEYRASINTEVFEALKPGGLYGVIDHTRRHMEPDDSENRRRMDPVIAIKEALDAGFEFVDYSPLHYRPDDELRYEVGRRSVAGNTDRFTLLFRKP
ncbi:MAG: methyltransferase [Pseudomonadota bacterium]